MPIRWHEEAPDDLREAISYTYSQTTFTEELIEKDYFCSVLLEAITQLEAPLVFKGGTCLAKVHTGFTRLSEDLDFSIPLDSDAGRAARSRAIEPVKAFLSTLRRTLPGFVVNERLKGHNESKQYTAGVTYPMLLREGRGSIKLEIGIREPLLHSALDAHANTLVRHWADGTPLVPPIPVAALSYPEAMAEKLRAALTRLDVAVRDFFDVDKEVRKGTLDQGDPTVVTLLRGKLAVPGTGPVDLTPARLAPLKRQVEAQLRPVLRDEDAQAFDLERAIETVRLFAESVRA